MRGETRVEAEHLGPLPPFVAVCAASYPLADPLGAGWSAVDLAGHLPIAVTDPSPMTEGQDFGVLSPGTWRVSDLATKLALILAGTGWGNLPHWMAEQYLQQGNLACVAAAALGRKAETPAEAHFLRRIDEPLRPAARHLRTRLLLRFAERENVVSTC